MKGGGNERSVYPGSTHAGCSYSAGIELKPFFCVCDGTGSKMEVLFQKYILSKKQTVFVWWVFLPRGLSFVTRCSYSHLRLQIRRRTLVCSNALSEQPSVTRPWTCTPLTLIYIGGRGLEFQEERRHVDEVGMSGRDGRFGQNVQCRRPPLLPVWRHQSKVEERGLT